MGKLYISLEDDLNLLDLIRGQVAEALEILVQSPKTKAEYAKSFRSALHVVQNIKKLLNFSTQATNEGQKKQEAEQERKNEPCASTQNASSDSNQVGTKPDEKLELQSIAGNSAQPCPSTESEPIRKMAKTMETPKIASGAQSTTTVLLKPVDDRTPAQKALANSLIVHEIMENLPTRTLKSCRMVCTLWMEEATKKLLTYQRHPYLEVKLRWSKNENEYQHVSFGSLQSLLDDGLKKSRHFPWVQFQFIGGYLSSPGFLNFFTKFGANVKFLRLSPSTNNAEESSLALKNLGVVLFKLAPNLEGLSLDSMDWTRGQDFPKEIEMPANKKERGFQKSTKIQPDPQMAPNLKKLALSWPMNPGPAPSLGMNHALVNLLNRAPNLVQIVDENLYFTREIVAAGKFGLIKSLNLQFQNNNPASDRLYAYFSEQGPQLKTIEFATHLHGNANSTQKTTLSAILRSSQNTLKTVVMLSEVDFRSFRIPRLEKVEHLDLHANPGLNEGLILPRNKKLVACFPNLTTITYSSKIWRNPANSSKTVEKLFVTMKPTPQLIGDTKSLYPNLKLISLTFDDYEAQSLPETIKAICSSFPRLEILRIYMTVWDSWLSLAEMDSAFTGLPLSLCKDPGERQRKTPDAKILQSLEKNGQPSIRNLKQLKELKIGLIKYQNITGHRICTRISDLYAFDLMKQRQGLKFWETVKN